jgi:hypothetical protein
MSYYGQEVVPGPPPPLPPPQYAGPIKKSNGLAVAGFVLSLLGVLGSFIPFANIFFALLALLGLIFGIIGLVTSGSKGAGKGLSIAAIILAVPAVVISIAVTGAAASWVQTKVQDLETAEKTAAPVTGKIGQPVKDGKLTFVVKSVKCGMTTYDGSLPSEPLGEFCVVDVAVSNHGQSEQTVDDILVEGFIAGSRYPANPEATLKANPDPKPSIFGRRINPGGSIRTVVLIDVPVGQQLDIVELHDSPLSDGTSVSAE